MLVTNSTGNVLYAVAYNSDGTINPNILWSDISATVNNMSLTLSEEDVTNLGNGRVQFAVPDSVFEDYRGRVQIVGTFTDGYLLGDIEWVDDTLVAVKAKTDLLGMAPTGSVLLVASGCYYCTRTDVELVFGQKNVLKWADLDNDGDEEFIESRVCTMIALAHEQTNDAIRAGGYTVPVQAPIPTSLSYHVAALAGVLLYESRGAIDSENEDGTHRLTPFRKRWSQYVQDVLGQKVILSAGKSIASNAPFVS